MSIKVSLSVLCLSFALMACTPESAGFRPKIGVGDQVPPSNNLTVTNPDEWYKVSSMDTKVPLYQWRIA